MNRMILFCLSVALFVMTACTPNGPHMPIDKSKLGATVVSGSEIISYQDIKPIFKQYCSRCHPSRRAPNWLDFDQARANTTKLVTRVYVRKDMPAAGSSEAQEITQKERDLLKAWVDSGALFKKGDAPSLVDIAPITMEQIKPSLLSEIQTCTSCHGTDGNIEGGSVPKLASQSSDYIFKQLKNYASGVRQDRTMQAMNGIAKTLFENYSEKEVQGIANFFSGVQLKREELTNEEIEQISVGQKLSNTCAACHMSPSTAKPIASDIPVITGQNKDFLYKQLVQFKTGERESIQMNLFAKALTDEELNALAIYFSSIEVR